MTSSSSDASSNASGAKSLERQLDACTQALDAAPDDANLLRRRGKLLHKLGRATEAQASLAASVHLSLRSRTNSVPPDAIADFAQALKAMRHHRHDQAETWLRRIVQQHPRAVDAWIALRGTVRAQGRVTEADAVGDAWRAAAAADSTLIDVAMARRVSEQGLIVDWREPLDLVSKDEVLRRVVSADALRSSPDDSCLVTGAEGLPVRHDPIISVASDGSDSFPVQTESTESFVAALHHAALVGRGLVVTQRNQVIRETLFPLALSEKYEVDISGNQLQMRRGQTAKDLWSSVRIFDGAAFLMAGPTDTTFGDWIWKFPPRLTLARQAGFEGPLVVNAHLPQRYLEMLELLGYDRSRLLFHDPDTVSLFRRLLVPSWATRDRLGPMKDWMSIYEPLAQLGLQWWREREGNGHSKRPLLYVARTRIRHRSMVNEKDVVKLFKRRGFQIVRPEAMTWREVMPLFACPAVVAGAYGSGLRNLVMCRQKPLALLMMPPWFNTPGAPTPLSTHDETFMIGAALWLAEAGIRFAYVRGEEAPNPAGTESMPWRVDLERLEVALDRVLSLAETS